MLNCRLGLTFCLYFLALCQNLLLLLLSSMHTESQTWVCVCEVHRALRVPTGQLEDLWARHPQRMTNKLLYEVPDAVSKICVFWSSSSDLSATLLVSLDPESYNSWGSILDGVREKWISLTMSYMARNPGITNMLSIPPLRDHRLRRSVLALSCGLGGRIMHISSPYVFALVCWNVSGKLNFCKGSLVWITDSVF